MATLETLIVSIEANAELLRRELARAEAGVEKFRNETDKHLGGINSAFSKLLGFTRTALGAFGIALSVQWAVNFAKQTILSMDALDDLSKQLNVSVESFQRLQFAFGRAGVDAGRFEFGLRQLNTRLGQMQATGKGPLADLFRRLEIDATGIRNAEEALFALARAWDKAGNEAQQATAAQNAFGRGGQVFAQLLAEGPEKIAEEMKNATVWTQHQTSAANDLKAAFGRLVDQGKLLTGVLVEYAALLGEAAGVDELQSETRTAAEEVEHLRRELELLDNSRGAKTVLATIAASLGLLPLVAPAPLLLDEARQRLEAQLAAAEEAAYIAEMRAKIKAANEGKQEPPLTEPELDAAERWTEAMETAAEKSARLTAELQRLHRTGAITPEVFRRASESLEPFTRIKPATEVTLLSAALRASTGYTDQYTTALARLEEELENVKETARTIRFFDPKAFPEAESIIRRLEADIERQKRHFPGQGDEDVGEQERTLAAQIKAATRGPTEALFERLQDIDRLEAGGHMLKEEAIAAREATLEDIEQIKRSFAETDKELTDAEKSAQRFGQAIAASFESRGMEAILNGDVRAGIRGMLDDFAELIFRITVLEPLAEQLAKTFEKLGKAGEESGDGKTNFITKIVQVLLGGKGKGKSSGGSTGPSLGDIEGFAAGGPIAAGQLALVGEQGPEWFVPDVAGTIMNASQMRAAGGGVVIKQTFNVQAGLPPQWEAQLIGVGQLAASSAYRAVTQRNRGQR